MGGKGWDDEEETEIEGLILQQKKRHRGTHGGVKKQMIRVPWGGKGNILRSEVYQLAYAARVANGELEDRTYKNREVSLVDT